MDLEPISVQKSENNPSLLKNLIKIGSTCLFLGYMANHASTRTTQLYDRRRDDISLEGEQTHL